MNLKDEMERLQNSIAGAPAPVQLGMALATAVKPLIQNITDGMSQEDQYMFYMCFLSGIGGFIEASLGIGTAAEMMIRQSKVSKETEKELREIAAKVGH